jgi:Subtilase family
MNRYVYLNNEKKDSPKFNRKRYVPNTKKDINDEEIKEDSKTIKDFQKERLRNFNAIFYTKLKQRRERRSREFQIFIDLIKISFFNTFNSELKTKLYEKYGILPIELTGFNKTVTFEILDLDKFSNFKKHIEIIIKSKQGTTYEKTEYNTLALVYEFEYIDSGARLLSITEDGVILNLLTPYNKGAYKIQKESLFTYLKENNYNYSYNENIIDLIEIQKIPRNILRFLADNFDIISAITSSRVERIKPGFLGPIRGYNFEISIANNIPSVGIIDSGIGRIEPLKKAIFEQGYDHTNNGAFWDEIDHGTLVAGLVILGDDFYKEIQNVYTAKAKVVSIKVIHQRNDAIDIPRLINDIKDAKNKYSIRIFNMSLVIPGAKRYNDSFSQFAYELDKLSFSEDVLIFISVGNFNDESLRLLIEEFPHPDHEYPDFFYKLSSTTDSHNCEDTNICIPSESLNNISVGALAGNLELERDFSDVTPNMIYPAYYTRKFHYDYSQLINSQNIKVKNKHLNKPDLVFEGGDLFKDEAGIEILKSPIPNGEYYGRTCGTSLATPLITSYAAELLSIYPNLRTQTIKALLINASNYPSKNSLPDFKNKKDSLLRSLVGFGKPNKNLLFSNSNKEIVYVIEDEISVGEIISRPLFLPLYLKESGNKLQFDIVLCYSFLPTKNNQLDYLPLHISFNITKNIDINLLADGVIKRGDDTNPNKEEYGIKNFKWSEDHFSIDNLLFSNSQKMQYRLQPEDYNSIENNVAITIRCLAKNEYVSELSKKAHKFSLVLRVTEIVKNENEYNLYNEMMEINNYIDIDGGLNLDNLIEIEA